MTEDRLADPTPAPIGPSRVALQPLDPQRLLALREALRPHGLRLQQGEQRPGELWLTFAMEAEPAAASTLTLTISPRDEAQPAFLRTRRFDVGYRPAADGSTPLPKTQILSLAKQFYTHADGPEVARHLLAAIQPAANIAAPYRDRGAESAMDAVARPTGNSTTFRPANCSRRPEVAARVAGPGALLVARTLEPGEDQAETWDCFTGAQEPGSTETSARAMAGRSWARTAQGLQRLTLHATCADCAVRAGCAGCWQVGERQADANSHLRRVLHRLQVSDPVEPVGPEMTTLVGSLGSSNSPPVLVISGADLAVREVRLAVAKRLRLSPRPASVVIVGRQPGIIAEFPDALGQPDLLSQLRPADAPLVARSLLGGALELRQAQWPGRDEADAWWLQYAVRPAGDRAQRPVEHVTLLLNRRCVTVCRYCDLPLRLREDMPLRQVWSVLEEVAAQGATSLEFFGGEVTLRPDLMTILARARELGLQTFVTTTGVGLDDNKLQALAHAGIHDLSISCDAADPAIHDDLKSRQGMHAAALRAARGLRRHGAAQLGWNSVVTPFNLDELPKVVELAADLGLDGATFFLCQPVAELGNATPLLNRDQYRLLLEEILPRCHELGRARGVHVGIRPAIDREPTPQPELLQRLTEGTYNRIHATPSPCRVVDHMVSIHADGDVRLCNQPLLQFEESAVIGNLKEHRLQELFCSPQAQAFRAAAGHLEVCRYCTFDHATDGVDRGLSAQVAGEMAGQPLGRTGGIP